MKCLIDGIFIFLGKWNAWLMVLSFTCYSFKNGKLRLKFLSVFYSLTSYAIFDSSKNGLPCKWINYMIECILIRLLHDDWCLKNGHTTLLQHLGFYLLRMTGIFVWWILPSFNECWSSSFWSSFFGFCWLNWFIFFLLHWSRCTILKYLSDYSCNLISSYSSRCW